MKVFKSVAVLSALVCVTSLVAPVSAFARPHKVCHVGHHHHRVCHWVR